MRRLLLAAALLASACSSAPPPVEMADYCMREATSLCGLAMRCGCGLDLPSCVANRQAACNGVLGATDLSMAITAGTVHWDAAAATTLLAKADATPMICGHVIDVFDTTLLQAGTYDGALVGTLPAGSPCITLAGGAVEECAAGTCIAGHCARRVDIGGACDTSTVCVDFSRSIQWDSATDPSAICAHNVCVRQSAPPGEACTSGAECASATCTMLSCQGLPTGLGCIDDAACASLSCTGGHCAASACAAPPCPLGICADLGP